MAPGSDARGLVPEFPNSDRDENRDWAYADVDGHRVGFVGAYRDRTGQSRTTTTESLRYLAQPHVQYGLKQTVQHPTQRAFQDQPIWDRKAAPRHKFDPEQEQLLSFDFPDPGHGEILFELYCTFRFLQEGGIVKRLKFSLDVRTMPGDMRFAQQHVEPNRIIFDGFCEFLSHVVQDGYQPDHGTLRHAYVYGFCRWQSRILDRNLVEPPVPLSDLQILIGQTRAVYFAQIYCFDIHSFVRVSFPRLRASTSANVGETDVEDFECETSKDSWRMCGPPKYSELPGISYRTPPQAVGKSRSPQDEISLASLRYIVNSVLHLRWDSVALKARVQALKEALLGNTVLGAVSARTIIESLAFLPTPQDGKIRLVISGYWCKTSRWILPSFEIPSDVSITWILAALRQETQRLVASDEKKGLQPESTDEEGTGDDASGSSPMEDASESSVVAKNIIPALRYMAWSLDSLDGIFWTNSQQSELNSTEPRKATSRVPKSDLIRLKTSSVSKDARQLALSAYRPDLKLASSIATDANGSRRPALKTPDLLELAHTIDVDLSRSTDLFGLPITRRPTGSGRLLKASVDKADLVYITNNDAFFHHPANINVLPLGFNLFKNVWSLLALVCMCQLVAREQVQPMAMTIRILQAAADLEREIPYLRLARMRSPKVVHYVYGLLDHCLAHILLLERQIELDFRAGGLQYPSRYHPDLL